MESFGNDLNKNAAVVQKNRAPGTNHQLANAVFVPNYAGYFCFIIYE